MLKGKWPAFIVFIFLAVFGMTAAGFASRNYQFTTGLLTNVGVVLCIKFDNADYSRLAGPIPVNQFPPDFREVYYKYLDVLTNELLTLRHYDIEGRRKDLSASSIFERLIVLGTVTNADIVEMSNLMAQNSLDSIIVLEFSPEDDLYLRAGRRRDWHTTQIMMKLYLTDGYMSYYYTKCELVSIHEIFSRQREVRLATIGEMRFRLHEASKDTGAMAEMMSPFLKNLPCYYSLRTMYCDLTAGGIFSMPSEEMARVLQATVENISSTLSTPLRTPLTMAAGLDFGASFGFLLGKSFILGVGGRYNYVPPFGSKNPSSVPPVNVTVSYQNIQAFLILGFRLFPNDRRFLSTLTLEPGYGLLINYNIFNSIGDTLNSIDVSGPNCCYLNLRWAFRVPLNRKTFLGRNFNTDLGFGLLINMTGCGYMIDANGYLLCINIDSYAFRLAGYNSSTYYYPQAGLYTLNIGLYASLGFGI